MQGLGNYEVSLPVEQEFPPNPTLTCMRLMMEWPYLPNKEFQKVLEESYDHYIANLVERPLLSDEGFRAGFEFARSDFIRIRAALLAYSNFCLGMSDASEFVSQLENKGASSDEYERELLEWIAPLLNRDHIMDIVVVLTEAKKETVSQVLDLFIINLDALEHAAAGEGFFPPFLKLGDAVLFSPRAVKITLLERNLLYSLNKLDKDRFNKLVSSHLEPSLLEDARKILLKLEGVQVFKNVKWAKGEIDILAYHEASNSAFQVQAKASIPPHGLRMVQHIESRTLEAAEQINRFLALSNDDKDDILSSATKCRVIGANWTSGVLVQTCFGTQKAWNSISEMDPLNPLMLRAVVKRGLRESMFSFSNLDEFVKQELASLRETAVLEKNVESIDLFGRKIELPRLDLDYEPIREFQKNALN